MINKIFNMLVCERLAKMIYNLDHTLTIVLHEKINSAMKLVTKVQIAY